MTRLSYLLAIPVLLCSCSKNIQNPEAIKQAVLEHLSSRKGLDLNMAAMDLDVSSVSYRENEADATVGFRPKGSNTVAMSMKYTLERQGDKWVVKSKKDPSFGDAGASPHGAAADPQAPTEMPPGHPPLKQ